MCYRKVAACAAAAILATALACSKNSQETPTAPTTSLPADGGAAGPDGVTLKVTAPTPQSPVNGQQPDSLVLVAGKSTAEFANTPALSYEFEIYNSGNTRVYRAVQAGGDGTSVSHTVTGTLEFDQPHTWRVRAIYGGAAGPWSSSAEFRSPVGGYLRGNELFDPLTNGETKVASRMNDVTFIPGVGVRLNSRDSFVEYRLQQPCVDCEMSAMMTNLGNGSEEWKTKVLSMVRGDGVNTTDNAYRVTLDKRTSWFNQGSVIRYTMRSRGVDAGEPKSGRQSWNRANTYFWQFLWSGGQARLIVRDGGRNGSVKANLPTSYKAPYSPDPHLVRLGSVGGRAGNDTNPGTIIWNIWVSPNPRPNLPGDK